jgi:hypothetical protein
MISGLGLIIVTFILRFRNKSEIYQFPPIHRDLYLTYAAKKVTGTIFHLGACHFLFITFCLSLPVYHFLFITFCLSLPVCHFLLITIDSSQFFRLYQP